MLALVALLLPRHAMAAERGFITIEAADIDRSESWYVSVFGVKQVNRFDWPAFDQRILIGDDVILELVESKPSARKADERHLGIVKAGVQIGYLNSRLKAWRAADLAPAGGLIFDEALGLATVLLRDPGGNIIQIFGKSAGPFDATLKVSPDHKAQ